MKKIWLLTFGIMPFLIYSQQKSIFPSGGKKVNYLGTTAQLRNIIPVTSPKLYKEVPEFDHAEKTTPRPVAVQHDPVVQRSFVSDDPIIIEENFEGVPSMMVSNPDTEGDVGPNHYFQMVKRSFMIWDKQGNILYGPADNSTLWNSFPGPWHDLTWTDPIIIYDHLDDRWLASCMVYDLGVEYFEMIAISATPDPLGEWHCYSLWFDKMPDYPKFGLWPDGYYLTINEYIITPSIQAFFDGASILVFNREELMNGANDPTVLYFHHEAPNQSFTQDIASFQPSDLDGLLPPPGTPNYHICVRDDDWGWEQDRLWIWECAVDWDDTASSHFSEVAILETEPFNSNYDFMEFIHQPNTTARLHSLTQFLMYRLQYRYLDGHHTLLCNHTVEVDGNDHGGIRWYELRNDGLDWYIYQQSTFAPDEHSRWMASMAMDGDGNIALGYSVSSDEVYPSIRVSGRHDYDSINLMTCQETSIAEGEGFQHTNPRWGDYSTMSVDPSDDLTFWYTQEYIMVSGSLTWQTRVASFQLQKNFTLSADSIVFMTYEECFEGKKLVLKNNSTYSIEVNNIEPEGYYSGAGWFIDPYNFTFPFQINPGDSVAMTIKVDFPVEHIFSGFEVDTLDILTDYKDYGIPIFVNDELMTGISPGTVPVAKDVFSVHPNPFTTSTTLSYTLDEPENVQFTVYNVQSRIVYQMQEKQSKGEQRIQWNAEGLPSEMYYFRIQAGEQVGGGKMVKME